MATTAERLDPAAALLNRYRARRGLTISDLARMIDRDRKAIRRLLDGDAIGLKPWQGESLFWLLVRAMEIPEREALRALAGHFQVAVGGPNAPRRRARKTLAVVIIAGGLIGARSGVEPAQARSDHGPRMTQELDEHYGRSRRKAA